MHLSALYRFPLKSARAQTLQRSPLDGLGLCGDRRWMLVDDTGRFLTQRVLPRMSQLSALYAADGGLILSAPGLPTLQVPEPSEDAPLRDIVLWKDNLRVPDAGAEAAAWVSEFLGKSARLVYVPRERTRRLGNGFGEEDDRVAFADGFPLLLIGQASLEDLASRVGRPLEMLRFRPNLVIDGSDAYAEDGWKRIRIGTVEFRLLAPCARCILTTVDPQTGERSGDREPLATLKGYRLQGNNIMFRQNLVSEGVGELEVGMPVTVLE
jgi:uncharacterized protein YcbX